ncbi:MAG TPA: DUF2845 domain-containing protein [Cellvibrionaceae bacterium]|nr:DUF2845 domain-containing protein [Cellvibrionaceae bacterium]HMW49307.1 DUF2845 domain-containing protein [Cellvibrionaceae bacterium]HMW71867.1 DUF2845 domain-containing protein [Cellvibrionaceae bacterium]HMY38899.1 DUF2845 domain-containing protein [Marinagarivorans sp.]HNG60526.1 DUF2845 domain-containing protein [Cellvibrionaceae bacterium]
MKLPILTLLCSLLLSPVALALRCGSDVIDEGMRKIEVEQKCGPPASKDSRIEYRTVRKHRSVRDDYSGYNDLYELRQRRDRQSEEEVETVQVVIEEWVYNFGSTRFMQLLIFEDGRLKEIKDMGYGK